MQSFRVCFYRLISSNRPSLISVDIKQPVHFAGKGKVIARRVTFGVFPSPFFLTGSIYIEARAQSAKIEIGEGTYISNNAVIIADKSSISIGKNCLVGWNFTVIDSDFHGLSTKDRLNGHYLAKPVEIGDNVFIGNNVTVTKGVVIGNNSVIGANAVVTKDVESDAIYAGNPAQYVKPIPHNRQG
jgi:maltose O-acetyltransferase